MQDVGTLTLGWREADIMFAGAVGTPSQPFSCGILDLILCTSPTLRLLSGQTEA